MTGSAERRRLSDGSAGCGCGERLSEDPRAQCVCQTRHHVAGSTDALMRPRIGQSVKYSRPLGIHRSGTKDRPPGDGAGGACGATVVIALRVAATQPRTSAGGQTRRKLEGDDEHTVGNVDDDAGGLRSGWLRVGVSTTMSTPKTMACRRAPASPRSFTSFRDVHQLPAVSCVAGVQASLGQRGEMR